MWKKRMQKIQNIFELPFVYQMEGLFQISLQTKLLEGVIYINV